MRAHDQRARPGLADVVDHMDAALLEASDDDSWRTVEGIQALKGTNGENLKISGSFYSWGPYPRNRRVLADIALAAGWGVEKARALERRCVRRMVQHFLDLPQFKSRHEILANPIQPMYNNSTPFTFQHISWSFLTMYVPLEMEEMDPHKMAAVKAAVLDRYEKNSATGKKVLPVYDKDTQHISDDLPVSEEEIKRVQEDLDKKARYIASVNMKFDDKSYVPPERMKMNIQSYIITHKMTEADFCEKIHVTEDELQSFMVERKKRSQEESKVFHNAHAFITKGKVDDGPPRKRRRQATIEVSDDEQGSAVNS